jgi:hypothetical protein
MPRITVVIPTRERADTLYHTLRTLVSQKYEDCEILVSDNASSDNTKSVVDSFSDPRVRYIDTGSRLSMSDNWEFALGHVRGEFVTYIGDDDGFVPGAIGRAMKLIDDSGLDALVWDKAQYAWPDHVNEDTRNRLYFRPGNDLVRVVEGRRKLRQVLLFRELYERLPCLYNGVVRTSLLTSLRDRSTNGIFFNSISPDIYSAIALSATIGRYLLSEYPFTVNGASRHSNGSSMGRDGKNQNSAAAKFLSENSRQYDQRLLLCPSVATAVAGEFLLAGQFLPDLELGDLHWGHYIQMLIRTAQTSPRREEILASASHTAKAMGIKLKTSGGGTPSPPSRQRVGVHGDTLVAKLPETVVSNIYDACQVVGGFLSSETPEISTSSSGFIRKLVGRNSSQIRNRLFSEAKTAFRSF